MKRERILSWDNIKTNAQKKRILDALFEELEKLKKSHALKDLTEEDVQIGNSNIYITTDGDLYTPYQNTSRIYLETRSDIEEYFEAEKIIPKDISRTREQIEA